MYSITVLDIYFLFPALFYQYSLNVRYTLMIQCSSIVTKGQ